MDTVTKKMFGSNDPAVENSCSGFCSHCGKKHVLPEGPARRYCYELIEMLDKEKRIDFLNPPGKADPCFSTDYLFGRARGQMFGVLVCEDDFGERIVLQAFSGQYNGVWQVEGWVPPLLSVRKFEEVSSQTERTIKKIGREIAALAEGSPERQELIERRRALSRNLMKDIHRLYELTNFRGMTKSLPDVFSGTGGIPTGTGDCCAPKLLNCAARSGLRPLGLAEFFYGKENRSGGRRHGLFYKSCIEKCQPILGYLLCGADRF